MALATPTALIGNQLANIAVALAAAQFVVESRTVSIEKRCCCWRYQQCVQINAGPLVSAQPTVLRSCSARNLQQLKSEMAHIIVAFVIIALTCFALL